ncbi:methyltransferase domain-containing protein [Actinomadura barringtoniae]|uniref:Methyltransferase domain-containing protein n=1 Tax=Actinomadura barringtoniae TaxID=1427535 RepID=A0A939PIG5_9ACTN|nr:methyltransferase domain-containing protein [Actinomadura barringtoniae]MBO2453507.1 methyltransferase domain-containing protein [Actinomadura barringtoniae]
MSTAPSDIEALIPLLDAVDATPGAAELRARSYELLGAAPGSLVVDIGCGAGCAVAELTDLGVRAVGIDLSEQMVAVARHRRPDCDVRLESTYELPFQDGEVSGYRAEKVFHNLADPTRAMSEARRVLVSGGRIVLLAQDWDTVIIDSSHPQLTRTIVHARADQIEVPRAARAYRNTLLDAGFQNIHVEAQMGIFAGPSGHILQPMLAGLADATHKAGAITEAEADAWLNDQRERAQTDRTFIAIPIFIASATAP